MDKYVVTYEKNSVTENTTVDSYAAVVQLEKEITLDESSRLLWISRKEEE